MKTTIQALGFGAMLVAVTAGHAFADDVQKKQSGGTTTYERSTTMDEQDLRKLTLKVMKVDKANHRVTFEAKVDPEANVESASGQPIKLDQLKEGSEVRASFDPATGEVKKLEITRPGESQGGAKQSNENMKK